MLLDEFLGLLDRRRHDHRHYINAEDLGNNLDRLPGQEHVSNHHVKQDKVHIAPIRTAILNLGTISLTKQNHIFLAKVLLKHLFIGFSTKQDFQSLKQRSSNNRPVCPATEGYAMTIPLHTDVRSVDLFGEDPLGVLEIFHLRAAIHTRDQPLVFHVAPVQPINLVIFPHDRSSISKQYHFNMLSILINLPTSSPRRAATYSRIFFLASSATLLIVFSISFFMPESSI